MNGYWDNISDKNNFISEGEDKDAGLLVDGTSYANFSYDYGNGGDGDGDKEYDPTECYDSNNSDQGSNHWCKL